MIWLQSILKCTFSMLENDWNFVQKKENRKSHSIPVATIIMTLEKNWPRFSSLMFTLPSVLFLHNKWQQNEHDNHLYDSSLWKYSTHQTCFRHVLEHQKIYIIATAKNREKKTNQRQNRRMGGGGLESLVCCYTVCAWKSAYCVKTQERGGRQSGRD